MNHSTTAIGPPHLGQRHSGCAVEAFDVSETIQVGSQRIDTFASTALFCLRIRSPNRLHPFL